VLVCLGDTEVASCSHDDFEGISRSCKSATRTVMTFSLFLNGKQCCESTAIHTGAMDEF
jgi:hypothetical protein